MRAALYLRVSSDRQTVENQLQTRFCYPRVTPKQKK